MRKISDCPEISESFPKNIEIFISVQDILFLKIHSTKYIRIFNIRFLFGHKYINKFRQVTFLSLEISADVSNLDKIHIIFFIKIQNFF